MKITELVTLLEAYKSEHGDLEVIAQAEHVEQFMEPYVAVEYSANSREYGGESYCLICEEEIQDYIDAEKRLVIGG